MRAATQKTGAKSPIRTFIELRWCLPVGHPPLSVPASLYPLPAMTIKKCRAVDPRDRQGQSRTRPESWKNLARTESSLCSNLIQLSCNLYTRVCAGTSRESFSRLAGAARCRRGFNEAV